MWETILVSVLSFLGTLAGAFGGMRLMTYRIEQLEKKVDKHNGLIDRMYKAEQNICLLANDVGDLKQAANHG